MNQIIFNKTSNILLNSGIIGLDIYLEKYKDNNDIKNKINFNSKLEKDKLIVESDDLYKLLEYVYYMMGKNIYDTSGKKARENPDKYYFIKSPFKSIPFYKMKTYGLGELITNDAAPIAGKNGIKIKFDKLIKEDYDFALKIAKELYKKGKKLKFYTYENNKIKDNEILKGKRKENIGGESEIFINAGYTKTRDLSDFDLKYFEVGEEKCYLTGESFKKLIDTQNTSPFLSGINNFESCLKTTSKKISWKAMYLSRFSPVICFYIYISGLNSIVCYFFNSNNLENMKYYYEISKSLFKNEFELIENNYMSNFKLYNFYSEKKDAEDKKEFNDFIGKSELLFVLIYTFYIEFLKKNDIKSNILKIFNQELKKRPVSLINFKSDKFASTLRPNYFDEMNNFKFIIQLIIISEEKSISFKVLLNDLKFMKNSYKNSKNSFKLERILRDKIISKIINKKSILNEIESLFYNIFLYKISGDDKRFRDYKNIIDFLIIYQSLIKYGGNIFMDEIIQEKAINLGSQIGMCILTFENQGRKKSQEITNVKNSRKYIISLNKARTKRQFLDEIIRIQNKYHIIVSSDILEKINDQNWEDIKRFTLISSLNILNTIYKIEKKEEIKK